MASFKDRMKELRLKLGLTQRELGDKLKKSESSINMYESGEREPKKVIDLVKIAEFFDVSLDYLLGRTDNPDIVILNEKDIPMPEEYKGIGIEIDANRKLMPKELTEDMIRDIIKSLQESGFEIKPKDNTKK